MSRTTLCVVTAAGLAVASVAVMVVRHQVLGDEVKLPTGPDTWKVTLLVQGKCTGDGKLLTATPMHFDRQHVLREVCQSEEMHSKPVETRDPGRRQFMWTQRARTPPGSFRARYECVCTVKPLNPRQPPTPLMENLYSPPRPGEYVQGDPSVKSDHPAIAALARRLTAGLDRPVDQAEALFRFVDQHIANEPTVNGPSRQAVECLENRGGDSAAKARLLLALCRNRGIPARLVTGLTLARVYDPTAHFWVEAWVRGQWLPMCPIYHYFGRVPRTYLIFGFGDLPMVRGRNVRGLCYAFLVERLVPVNVEAAGSPSWARQALRGLSLYSLPPREQRLVQFLLLLPVAALIVCLYRNVIGIYSFGTFAPALIGLAFRDLRTLPGILVFVSIVLIGWLMRRLLDRFHLLQVPRMAFLLSLVVLVLITGIIGANFFHLAATRYISLFPMVILTGMIERFWTLEEEDGTSSSFRALFGTILIAATISLVLSFPAVPRQMFRYPESLGLLMAAQLLIGRYTGYRLSELYRFRDFCKAAARQPRGRPQVSNSWILNKEPDRCGTPECTLAR